MRSFTRYPKTTKNPYKQKIGKRRYKSGSAIGCTHNIPILDFENINEVLRVHKTQRAEGKGAWKVVPKDSCEVYKNRRKRQAEEDNDDYSMRTTDSEIEVGGKKTQKKNTEKKAKKETSRKPRRQRKTNRQRNSKTRSDSTSLSTTSTYSSCFSSSEMDYDSN